MAAEFIKELLAERASPNMKVLAPSLSSTLKELFQKFFPGKEFLGPQPTEAGLLDFPVRTGAGAVHDLNELSAGEKEILYGYLRIRSSAPRNSIILLDEPELHLNPRLIRSLPDFYRRHLGEALENQLWLVTHSDALIREAIGKPGFNVFHMTPCDVPVGQTGQLRQLAVTRDLESVLPDLVGDLAAYRPGGKGLLFEGAGDVEFDRNFVGGLFRDELQGVNLLSGSNKLRVKVLHEVLERAYKKGDLPTKFYAVTDKDCDDVIEASDGVTRHMWDVYHVENYLLHDQYIADVLSELQLGVSIPASMVAVKLEAAARLTVKGVLDHRLRAYANTKLVGAINLGFDPLSRDASKELHRASVRSLERLSQVVKNELSELALSKREEALREEIERSFTDGTWRKVLPGREILRSFLGAERLSLPYDYFRNLIVGRMIADGYKPAGMKSVLDRIITE